MKKILIIAAIALCFVLPIFTVFVGSSDNVVVFVDGTEGTDGHYATLLAAANALPSEGGTIVVTIPFNNPTDSTNGVINLPAGKPLVITSVYGGVDYRESGAKLGIGRTFNLGADVKFENIDLVQNASGNTYGNIYCKGYKLEIGEGVSCTANSTGYYTNIYGGISTGYTTKKSYNITIKSGTWTNVYGGSYRYDKDASTTANITVEGGTITNLVGASRGYGDGNYFSGNVNVTIKDGAITNLYGGCLYKPFQNGEVTVSVSGGQITNLYGGSGNETFTGNSNISITGGSVTNLYGGNKAGTFSGNSTASLTDGTVKYLYGGSAAGTFTGDASVSVTGGEISGIVFGANKEGTFNGNTYVKISGTEMVNAFAGTNSAAFNGIANITVTGGKVTNLYGGNNGGAFQSTVEDVTATANVTVSGGEVGWVYGGNNGGTFTGNTVVSVTAGKVTGLVAGANRVGTFIGDSKVDLTGGEVPEVCGGIYGLENEAATFTGNVQILIHGNAVVNKSVYGSNYRSNVTVNSNVFVDIYENAILNRHVYGSGYDGTINLGESGVVLRIRDNVRFNKPSDNNTIVTGGAFDGTVEGDISVEISDNAYVQGNVYAAGYGSTLKGNSTAVLNGGEVVINFTAATRNATVEGNTTTIANGGKIGYYSPNEVYGIIASGARLSASSYGKITGTGTIILNGADVAGEISLGYAPTGTITLKSGKYGSVTGEAIVDLSEGGTLAVNGELNATELVGGGTIVLNSTAMINATEFIGSLNLSIDGENLVHDRVCLSVADPESTGTVNWLTGDGKIVTVVDGGVKNYILKLVYISGASLTLGKDLSFNYYVKVIDPSVLGDGSLAMRFVLGDKVTELLSGDVNEDGEYVFVFINIPPQCMSDNISATLYLVGENDEIISTIDEKLVYSIKEYAQSQLTNYVGDDRDEIVQLVSDMLHYGAAAQTYREYNLDNLANTSVDGIMDPSGSVPSDTDFDLVKPESETLYFVSAGVRFDYTNMLYVKISTTENARLVIKVNGETVSELTELAGTTVYTDPINATSFNDVYTFELYESDTLVQTLNYSIKSYVSEMMNKTDGEGEPTKMALLARALYAYGESAVAVRGNGN